jgi:hypothetical protein
MTTSKSLKGSALWRAVEHERGVTCRRDADLLKKELRVKVMEVALTDGPRPESGARVPAQWRAMVLVDP